MGCAREGEQAFMDSSSPIDIATHIGHGKLQRSVSDLSVVFLGPQYPFLILNSTKSSSYQIRLS